VIGGNGMHQFRAAHGAISFNAKPS
jgi:hypothetical protein